MMCGAMVYGAMACGAMACGAMVCGAMVCGAMVYGAECMVLRDSKEEERTASVWENPEWLQQRGGI